MTEKKIVVRFSDETTILKAIKRLKEKNIDIVDVYGPYATHDILKNVTRESRLPYLAVLYGAMALIGTFAFIYYTTVIDYPIVYGGKPPFSFPPMVVIMFLVTILATTILLALTFHGRTRIFPGQETTVVGQLVTDDTFYLVLNQKSNTKEVHEMLTEDGATDISVKEL